MYIKLHPNESSEAWKLIKSNWVIGTVTKCVIGFTALSILAIAWRWNRLPPMVPLWYSLPWGTSQLSPPIFLIILPIGALAIYFINLLLSMYVTAEYLIFTQILYLSSFVFSCLSLITLIKILFLVT